MLRGDDGFIEEVIEDETSLGNKISFEIVMMKQLERTTFFLSRLNDTPSYVFHAMSRPDNNLDPDNIKPNRDNFIFSVITLKTLLTPYHDKLFLKQEKDIEVEFTGKTSQQDDIDLAQKRFNNIMHLMSRKSLLPIQMLV